MHFLYFSHIDLAVSRDFFLLLKEKADEEGEWLGPILRKSFLLSFEPSKLR